jgi:predicted DCC family thiol-disulfide oxidoreductase YuxK
MTSQPLFPVTVFYDGSCIVCSREIEAYRQKPHEGRLRFIDICAADFDPSRYGRTLEEFMAQLHVRDAEGRFFRGVDAFPVIWQALPDFGYRFLGAILRFPGLHLLAVLGYRAFARLRRYLPKRRRDCVEESCNVGHLR